ncbi:uncharacterized protein TrAFT101_011446 [Trichoderma asperellum]|uniref:uncharacterized protein n=1 Tax=Trichoderma asperellum TaxID=101201 RepID=UPI00331A04E0|nr:hypothetical protein TrAFT101_011446 [Trichoderma asperellum]
MDLSKPRDIYSVENKMAREGWRQPPPSSSAQHHIMALIEGKSDTSHSLVVLTAGFPTKVDGLELGPCGTRQVGETRLIRSCMIVTRCRGQKRRTAYLFISMAQ